MKGKILIAATGVLMAVTASYSNHFFTDLHYDDYTTVRDNPAIRRLSNIPRFFIDSSTSSTTPAEYRYRPVVTSSLAVDYFLGKGSALYYHLLPFLFYLAGLAAIGWLYYLVFQQTIAHPWNPYLAILATAFFGLHPATAELLNAVSGRGELFADLSVVAGIALYAGVPRKRNLGLYLIPPLFGVLASPTALIFGPLLLAYIILIEPVPVYEGEHSLTPDQMRSRDETQAAATEPASGQGRKRIRIRRRKHPFVRYVKAQLTRFIPALAFTAAAGFFESLVNPFHPLGDFTIAYWFTQPWVAWRYFRSFFAPLHLGPASDLKVFESYDLHAVLGLAFVVLLISLLLLLAVSRLWRPAVFGLWWFLLGILPSAIILHSEVESDIRMFLPFIGIALSVTWTARMLLPSGEPLRRLEAIAGCVLLAALGYGTYERNRVWSSEETLWRDTVEKHPSSVRGLQNYAMALADQGRPANAYEYLWRAHLAAPDSAEIEARLGWVAAALKRPEAEEHFHHAMYLAADQPICQFLYAVWLEKQGRRADALEAYSWAAALAPSDLRPRYGMMRLYNGAGDWNNLRKTVEEAQALAPGDSQTMPFAATVGNHPDTVKEAELLVKKKPTPENYVTLSAAYWMAGDYNKCLEASQMALNLKSGYVPAYINEGVAYMSMGRLEDAIGSMKKALEFDPDNKIAHTNLREWESEKLIVGNAIMRK